MSIFEGKVALVTGGTTGIGQAAAIAFAQNGAKVVVSGRRTEEGEKTVHLIEQKGGKFCQNRDLECCRSLIPHSKHR
jgi:NAD(P)-dependent dehydrogenase (short-subunit alcohol dehydrogenase family)